MALTKTPIELSSTPGIVDNSNATAITIDSSENVTLAGTATAVGLTVTSSSSNAGTFKAVGGYAVQAYQDATSTDHTALELRSDHVSGGTDRYLIRGYNTAAGTPVESFNVNTAGGAYFAGNLLVSTTDTAPGAGDTNAGVSIRGGSDNRSFFSVNGDYVMHLNRNTNDGSILEFAKDGEGVGIIGSTSGTHLHAGSGDVGLLFQGTANAIEPWNPATNGARDNAIDLGLSGNRFKDIYLSGGVNFSANANAGGMTSETLNDYEEGTWTPTHSDGTALSIVGLARYTKIGNAVSINIDVSFTKTSAGISGLPFTSVTNTNQTFNVGYSSTSNNVNYGHMNPSTATIDAWYNTTNGSATFVNGDRVMVGGTYFTDS